MALINFCRRETHFAWAALNWRRLPREPGSVLNIINLFFVLVPVPGESSRRIQHAAGHVPGKTFPSPTQTRVGADDQGRAPQNRTCSKKAAAAATLPAVKTCMWTLWISFSVHPHQSVQRGKGGADSQTPQRRRPAAQTGASLPPGQSTFQPI